MTDETEFTPELKKQYKLFVKSWLEVYDLKLKYPGIDLGHLPGEDSKKVLDQMEKLNQTITSITKEHPIIEKLWDEAISRKMDRWVARSCKKAEEELNAEGYSHKDTGNEKALLFSGRCTEVTESDDGQVSLNVKRVTIIETDYNKYRDTSARDYLESKGYTNVKDEEDETYVTTIHSLEPTTKPITNV